MRTTGQTGRLKENFLKAFADSGTVTAACEAFAVARSSVYFWAANDQAFARQFRQVETAVVERLEREAVRRAMDGSDGLLAFLLRARRPATYRDNFRQMGIPNHESARQPLNYSRLTTEELEVLEGLIAKMVSPATS